MADPLRRTLLAKLRGKKSRKGAAVVGGSGSAAPADGGGHEGNGEVCEPESELLLAGPGPRSPGARSPGARSPGARSPGARSPGARSPAGRMSTYDNCVDGGTMQTGRVAGGTVQTGGVPRARVQTGGVGVPGGTGSGSWIIVAGGTGSCSGGIVLRGTVSSVEVPEGTVSGGRVQVNEQLLGVPLQRPREADRTPCSPGFSNPVPARPPACGPQVHTRLLVSVPRQCRVGDSIGFGDNSNRVLYRVQLETRSAESRGPGKTAETGRENNHTRGSDSGRCLDSATTNCAEVWYRNHVRTSTEESVLIRSLEGYEPDCGGEGRGAPGAPQSPTFFPTQLELWDQNRPSGCSSEARRFPPGSDDEDYYDNEILPFYETLRSDPDGDGPGSSDHPGPDPDGPSAQETDRLRNQLKEAYYLLISAMNGISLDEQQATSSCSSLSSRQSIRNMDSDSWSSGGDQSPRRRSDTDPLLLCLSDSLQSRFSGRWSSKSETNLCNIKTKPMLLRSASDGAIICFSGAAVRTRSGGPAGPAGPGGGEPPELQEVFRAGGGEEDQGEQFIESGSSVSSLAESSESNTEAPAPQGQDLKEDPSQVPVLGTNLVHKGHGVTVNKMQEWMHKGRVLSSEMKRRIEGSSLPRGGGPDQDQDQDQDRSGPLPNIRGSSSGRGTKTMRTRSPSLQQQPAFVESVQTCTSSREAGPAGEPASWRPQLTTITVSKKRNWLQQSSLVKNQCAKNELQGMLGTEEEDQGSHHLPPPPPSPSPDHRSPSGGATPWPAHLQLPQASAGEAAAPPPGHLDPAEENDADDEGEIWYNPIPEDEELDVSHRPPPRLALLQRRPGRGAEAGWTPGGSRAEVQGEAALVGGPGDASQGKAVHSTDLACRAQEDGGPASSAATDTLELPNAVGFSPPSSPNPAKKSSSINWSFPDKIKSPRTVRKISMKMKKLPELSRKLSVKGTASGGGGREVEPRASSPRVDGSGSDIVCQTSAPPRPASAGGGPASRNVISRYHLDSSVSTQHSFSKKKSGGSKSACKGGYLSDGDSPELLAKAGKHGSAEGKGGKAKEPEGGGGATRLNGTELDIDAFRHYSFTEQPKCSQYISGLMSLHFYGAEDLKPPRIDSRDVYCAIQVDSVNKARTALLTCRTAFLDMDHTFNIELENAQHLKLVVFSWEPTPRRNRVCCHGTVVLPALFRVTRCHQLAVKLEPRGLIYVKLSLMEQWQNSLDGGPDADREPTVFGVEAWRVVERENSGLMVPLLISKCINEIEKRGCQVVGLYRLCGSAAVKKELREAFERDSHAVELSENTYPDINVITGVLKDYLRELPGPLITRPLYQAVLEAMAARPLRMAAAGCQNDRADSDHAVSLLENLAEVERVTLQRLLDHLRLVASQQEVNKMTCQNLAVCFGPVLLSQRQEASCHTNRVFVDSEELASALHFKKHIEVLHYLLQLWPVVDRHAQSSATSQPPPLRRRKERPQVLNFTEAEMAGVLRPKPGRLDSPSNRYAGDWSGCGESYFPSEGLAPPSREEVDYDDVASEDTEAAEERRHGADDGKVSGTALNSPEEELPPGEEEELEEELEEEGDSDGSNNGSLVEEEEEEEEEAGEREGEGEGDHMLPPQEHSYQAYMKIQDISPVLSNRVNLRDLQESIDTLIGNLERELNKNKLNVGY